MVEPGSENDVFTKDQWDDIQEGQPSQLSVMKEVSLRLCFWLRVTRRLAY